MADQPETSTPVQRVGARLGHPHPLRKWFVAILAVWLAIAVLLWGRLAQDAVPYIAAGQVVHAHPGALYPGRSGYLFDLNPVFSHQLCRDVPAGTNCGAIETGFVSMPAALPLAVVLGWAGPDLGALLARLVAAGALAGGMALLWRRLAGRSPRAPSYLVATALLLTPMVMVPLTLGQTSPLLFLAACLGVSQTDRPGRRSWMALLWALTIALKVFPAGLGLVLLWQRRFRLIVSGVVALAAMAVVGLVIAPASSWADFVHASVRLSGRSLANPYNGSLDKMASQIWSPLTAGHLAPDLLLAARLLLGAGLWWWGARKADDDTQWAFGWLVVLFVVPLVWWHYLWVGVAALGVALAGRGVDRRWLVSLPVMAAVSIPMSLVNAHSHAWPVAQGLFLLGSAVLVAVVAHSGAEAASPGRPTPPEAAATEPSSDRRAGRKRERVLILAPADATCVGAQPVSERVHAWNSASSRSSSSRATSVTPTRWPSTSASCATSTSASPPTAVASSTCGAPSTTSWTSTATCPGRRCTSPTWRPAPSGSTWGRPSST